jgi:hypothetical protein
MMVVVVMISLNRVCGGGREGSQMQVELISIRKLNVQTQPESKGISPQNNLLESAGTKELIVC